MQAFSAPGRVNLIGEHTDYTGGLVMPMAIDFETVAQIESSGDSMVSISSEGFRDTATYDLRDFPERGRRHWSDYPAGVISQLRKHGVAVPGLRLHLRGNVPVGAGLSSSASVEVATAVAVLGLTGRTLPPAEIALLCQAAENEYVGGACGIMDQFISVNGRAGHALLLDCRSLAFDLLPLPDAVRIVICNSMVQHSVAHGDYGDRRGEVEAGQAALRQRFPEVHLLRDATVEQLNAARDGMGEASFRRCRHIITENARVEQARTALLSGDLARFGSLMVEAHISFRDDFQASCPEVDTLVELARTQPGCLGARITGGGFGGCTVNLVHTAEAETFRDTLQAAYRAKTGMQPDCYISRASDGALAREA